MTDNLKFPKDKKIILVSHIYTTGPTQDLLLYLQNQEIAKLLFINHPLFYDQRLKGSGYDLYQNGKMIKTYSHKIRRFPEIFNYFSTWLFNIYWIIKNREKWDLYIGVNNLNALSGIFLKKFGLVKKTVYYVIDYNPYRFKNYLLNRIYHHIDLFCVKHCDETWNLAARMKKARNKYFGFTGGNQKVVPVGVWFERIKRPDFSTIDKKKLVFMGHLLETQGVQYVISAIPLIINNIPDFKFLIIGGGDYLKNLKEQVNKLKLEKTVIFTGYVEHHEDIEKMLSRCALAIALYTKNNSDGKISFSYFTDPGKIKSYLAAGLPIVMTDVPHNAREIENRECGIIINYDKINIAKNIVKILENQNILKIYRRNAVEYARENDWNLIFNKAFKEIF